MSRRPTTREQIAHAEDRLRSKLVNDGECRVYASAADKDGYGLFQVHGYAMRAHRVAWMLWRGEIPDGMFVLHRCDNPPCCNPDHLFLGTSRDNIDDMLRKGRQAKGERHGSRIHPGCSRWKPTHKFRLHPELIQPTAVAMRPELAARGERVAVAKLTDSKVLELRERFAAGERNCCHLAEEYGVSDTCIKRIVSGRGWRHVGGPITDVDLPVGIYKLTPDDVRKIRRLASEGLLPRVIAEQFGVCRQSVANIIGGLTWRRGSRNFQAEAAL